MAESERPGTMLYFSDYENLKALQPLQRLAIIDAFMEYAKTGKKPVFDDPTVQMVWTFGKFEHTADADSEKYEKRKKSAVKAINTRWEREKAKREQFDIEKLKNLAENI